MLLEALVGFKKEPLKVVLNSVRIRSEWALPFLLIILLLGLKVVVTWVSVLRIKV
jgi:hypothetical protein